MAKATDNQILEKAVGGVPLVRDQGLNTNKAVNFSGWQVTTGGLASGNATGPTGSFANINIQTAEITGATGSVAVIGTAGALAGGPTVAQQDGWAVIWVAGVKKWVPVWA